jgi:hypothetical protein
MTQDLRRGFYHPDIGYWETSHPPKPEYKVNYPSGYVEVPVPLNNIQTFNPITLLWEDDAVKELESLKSHDRQDRNKILVDSDYIMTRHRDQVDANESTTLTPSKYQEWLNYRTALRNLTNDANWPLTVNAKTLTAPS